LKGRGGETLGKKEKGSLILLYPVAQEKKANEPVAPPPPQERKKKKEARKGKRGQLLFLSPLGLRDKGTTVAKTCRRSCRRKKESTPIPPTKG